MSSGSLLPVLGNYLFIYFAVEHCQQRHSFSGQAPLNMSVAILTMACRSMHLSRVFRQANIGAAAKFYDTNCQSQNVTNTNIHSKKPSVNLPTLLVKKDAQWQSNFYVKIAMRCYATGTSVKRQKLLDRGFQDLYEELDLANAKTDIAKIVKFVLEQNIEVSKNNIDHSNVRYYPGERPVGGSEYKRYKERYGFKVGRFTEGENKIIQNNWASLMMLNSVEEPKVLLQQLKTKNQRNVLSQKRMRNIIGMYLGQGLDTKRHCANILSHTLLTLTCEKDGKYTPEDDKIILEEVEKNGDCVSTWKYLCSKLYRNADKYTSIRQRYRDVLLEKSKKSGKWSFEEDKTLLEHLFRDHKMCSIDAVKSIEYKDFKNVEAVGRVQRYMYGHWECRLKPILLSYHLNTLHCYDRLSFLRYILETGVEYEKEINWNEAVKKFPSQTHQSLAKMLVNFRPKDDTLNATIKKYQTLQTKKVDYTAKEKEFQEKIVLCYLDCCSSEN